MAFIFNITSDIILSTFVTLMKFILFLLMFMTSQIAAGNALAEPAVSEKMIPVTVKIDFGPAEKPSVDWKISVKEGATPKEALCSILSVQQGATCCDAREVKQIDGISADPVKNRWWRVKINGTSKNVSPYKSHLKANDIVEWIYFEDAQ